MKYGLLGKKLSHSYSPMIHRAIGNDDYHLIELPPEALDDYIKKSDFSGINVTIPYKKDVIPYCTVLSDTAKKIGSVNTIVNNGGRLYGYNTDYDGFLYMSDRAQITFKDRKVLILGSGGTSLTAAHAAADRGAREILIVSRSGSVNYNNIYEHQDADILINTTPVGMYPKNDEKLVDISRIPNLSGVIDVIYNPLKTNLLLDAAKQGIRHTNGLSMLIAQAVYASELFFNTTYDSSIIEKTLSKIQKEVMNIVLVGMPGSGKTIIGKAIADSLNRTFIDTDAEIEKKHNLSPAEILKKHGEEYFRALETEVVKTIAKTSRAVIATGGGVPLKEENRRALMQNSYICFLERPLDSLDISGRPLSQAGSLELLYHRRLPHYRSVCDIIIENNDTVANVTSRIIDAFEKQRTVHI